MASSSSCKKLRGWKLEVETGKAWKSKKLNGGEERLEKHLATSALWSARATMIRELASLAVFDGARHQHLIEIAQAGSWGGQPGNIHVLPPSLLGM